jgi:hypothetical protein
MSMDKCPFGKVDCFSFSFFGRCTALSNTEFSTVECPFYKTKAERYKGHEASIIRLHEIHRPDLIVKYGQKDIQPRIWREIEDGQEV